MVTDPPSEDGPRYSVETSEIKLAPGTPVICHGMKETTSNGRIGEIQEWIKERDVCRVVFEDESIKPTLLHRKNIRPVLGVLSADEYTAWPPLIPG